MSWEVDVTQHNRFRFLASVGVALLLAVSAGLAAASDNSVSFLGAINPPSTKSFDISWVENSSGKYFVADRANNAVDLINVANDTFSGFIGKGVFVGAVPAASCAAGGNACSGPDGVLTDGAGLVWVGDGNSTIKVLRPTPGTGAAALIKSIPTGGKFRADEEAYDPQDQLILIANDAEGFLTFIDVTTQTVAGHFYYSDNTVGVPASVPGHPTAGNGIEQPVWVPQTGLFYQAVPANSPSTVGFIDVFDPRTQALVDSFPVPGCGNGPTGLALGPNQRFLGACDNGAAAVEVRHGQLHDIIPDVAGADEIWFNPGDDNFYLGISGPPAKLGVVNANDDHVVAVLTGKGGHSVAAYAGNNHIFDPDRNGTGIDVFISGR
jgi:hypothetical protein